MPFPRYSLMPNLTPYAKRLRHDSTDAERLLWGRLRAHRLAGFKFRRQAPIGPYIVDFACFEVKLVLELDGGQHADEAKRDAQRDGWLAGQGFRVLRFWNNEVLGNLDGVLERVLEVLSAPSPQPSPIEGEGARTPRPSWERGGGEGVQPKHKGATP